MPLDNPFGAMTIIANDSDLLQRERRGLHRRRRTRRAQCTCKTRMRTFRWRLTARPRSGNPFSDLIPSHPRLLATAVYVGTSLESTIQDHLIGFVSAVSGNTVRQQR